MMSVTSVSEMPMGPPGSLPGTGASVDQRALESKARARRRWVVRTGSVLVVGTVTLCLVVVWQRDQITVTAKLKEMQLVVADLQGQIDKFGRLPAVAPDLAHGGFEYYASDADRYYASQSTDPIIIAATPQVPLLLKEGGRGVIIYHQGSVEARWVPGSELRRTLAEQDEKIREFEKRRRQAMPDLP